MEMLAVLEASGFSMWVKESSTAYVAVLAFHTIGLVFLVGISTATAMRILGIANGIPMQAMQDFFPLMYAGAAINVLTGTVLLTLYPTKYLVDPTFYIKLAAIGVAIIALRKIRALVFDISDAADTDSVSRPTRTLAWTIISAWLVALVAGRVMAYSVPTKLETAAAVLIIVVIAVLGAQLATRMGWVSLSEPDS
jgi:hypothetical protein